MKRKLILAVVASVAASTAQAAPKPGDEFIGCYTNDPDRFRNWGYDEIDRGSDGQLTIQYHDLTSVREPPREKAKALPQGWINLVEDAGLKPMGGWANDLRNPGFVIIRVEPAQSDAGHPQWGSTNFVYLGPLTTPPDIWPAFRIDCDKASQPVEEGESDWP